MNAKKSGIIFFLLFLALCITVITPTYASYRYVQRNTVETDSRIAAHPNCIFLENSRIDITKSYFVCKDGQIHLYGVKK